MQIRRPFWSWPLAGLLGLAVLAVVVITVWSCGSSDDTGGQTGDAVSACTHICQCEVGNDPACATDCQILASCGSGSGSIFGSCSTGSSNSSSVGGSLSFSFLSYFSGASWESNSSLSSAQRDQLEQQCFACIVSSSCQTITNGSACPTVCH
jgi:hypothetical protein